MLLNMTKKKTYHKIRINRKVRKTIDNETTINIDPVTKEEGTEISNGTKE